MAGQPGRVVIVGAGPAGMALAYLLARRGVDVAGLETPLGVAPAFPSQGPPARAITAPTWWLAPTAATRRPASRVGSPNSPARKRLTTSSGSRFHTPTGIPTERPC